MAWDDIDRWAGKGIDAACTYLLNKLKEKLSIPAPRLRTHFGWRAATRATPGAPPRKLTGNLRARQFKQIVYEQLEGLDIGVYGKVGSIIVYAYPLETRMNHPFLLPTLMENMDALARIVGDA